MNAHESSPSILIVDDDEALALAVIFIYAKTFAQDEDRGLTLGVVNFITKPFRITLPNQPIPSTIE